MNSRILTAAVLMLMAAVSASAADRVQSYQNPPADEEIPAPAAEKPAAVPQAAEKSGSTRKVRGVTDLMRAALAGDAASVKELTASGAAVDAADKLGRTALMYALSSTGGQQAAEALLQAGADVNRRDRSRFTPLMYALYSGYPAEFIERLTGKYGAWPERSAEGGITPMMIACQYAHSAEIVKILYQAGGEIRFPDARGRTPLHYASLNQRGNSISITSFLLENRAPLGAADNRGMTPLAAAAAWCSDVKLITLLLDAGAALESADAAGMTPLMHAASRSDNLSLAAVQLLADKGADFTARDHYNCNAFLCALRSCGSLDTVRWIEEHMKDMNAQDTGSVQLKDADLPLPLIAAAVNPTEAAPDIIRYLLERGEPLEGRDTSGRTALVCAVRYNASPLAAEALAEAGASRKIRWKNASLRQLLRYNSAMKAEDKVRLAAFFRKLRS
jgi:ankyrin repeat protein